MSDDLSNDFRHQIRNSLNIISVNAELLKLIVATDSDAETKATCIARILEECERCAANLNQASKPVDSSSDQPAAAPQATTGPRRVRE